MTIVKSVNYDSYISYVSCESYVSCDSYDRFTMWLYVVYTPISYTNY